MTIAPKKSPITVILVTTTELTVDQLSLLCVYRSGPYYLSGNAW